MPRGGLHGQDWASSERVLPKQALNRCEYSPASVTLDIQQASAPLTAS